MRIVAGGCGERVEGLGGAITPTAARRSDVTAPSIRSAATRIGDPIGCHPDRRPTSTSRGEPACLTLRPQLCVECGVADSATEERDPQSTAKLAEHAAKATSEYHVVHPHYVALAGTVRTVLVEALKRRDIHIHSVEARAKSPASFEAKARRADESHPDMPKYQAPLAQITDLAAARIIAYFPKTLDAVDKMLKEEFEIVERSDKGALLAQEDRLGYQSIHYLVRINSRRSALPEYSLYAAHVFEIQVRTILQHAWAEIEHDIQYKSTRLIPLEIRRRFTALAGMLEIADREFEAIQERHRDIAEAARQTIAHGSSLENVEITPDALKAFLDRRLGPDARIAEFRYVWNARLLHHFGFRTLLEVEQCIDGFDDDALSRLATGGRLGQLSRFEMLLLAALGDVFVLMHPWVEEPWFGERERAYLAAFRGAGLAVGSRRIPRESGIPLPPKDE